MSDPWGERVNRALFINFSPPMGDNLWLASKGQWNPEMFFSQKGQRTGK